MFKKLLLVIATLIATMGFAFAQVDVNKADQAALDGVKGIGPVKSKAIIEERTKGGNFKDWSDFETRVKGIGDKNSTKLSAAGLTVNGQAKAGAPAAAAKASAKASAPAPAAAAAPAAASAPAAAADKASKPTKASKKAAKEAAATAAASKDAAK
ncbi:ComEA family DNA-binding protein [Undibacterium sp.]|jgi:competence protein ComEA|uniref:ComEA family DNA-binding protein n=1 Tax=Undibacterium sp. TaxID=1914977 RepID=UPI002B8327B9|nr:helix-hairpin-helix domain-containing protein [Undibacterium sp.]HTD04260.1 helix-hairpin-helix domain-containing protein [Undibacterium sp.]